MPLLKIVGYTARHEEERTALYHVATVGGVAYAQNLDVRALLRALDDVAALLLQSQSLVGRIYEGHFG